MADQSSPFQFEDIPLGEARRLGRGPRMDPQLYQELRTKMQSLSDQAVRMAVPAGTRPNAMRNRLLGVAELGIPVTIRRVSGTLFFWRSTDEDVRQAKEVAARLRTARRGRHARPGRRRRAQRGAPMPGCAAEGG